MSWQKFRIESADQIPDGAGGFQATWLDHGWLWGRVKRMSGRGGARDANSRGFQNQIIELKDALGSGLKIGFNLVANTIRYEITEIGPIAGSNVEVFTRRENSDGI
jgi:hypothetical protein